MTGPGFKRIAACVVTGLLAAGVCAIVGPVVSAFPASAAEATALRVSIDSLSPATLPKKGELTVSGQVTNKSDDAWTGLNVYLLTSSVPITSAEELADASVSDPTAVIGDRLIDPDLYDDIGDLEPGSSVGYTLSVPSRDLQISGEPGVYWLGVHVLGASPAGDDTVADGRARTFIPLMDQKGPRTTVSVVMPLKAGVRRDPEGRIRSEANWQELLSPDGRLGRLLQLSGTSFGIPVTWVVDPAVVDAATSIAADNPRMSIGPTSDGDGDGQAEPDDGSSPSPTEFSDGSSAEPTDEPSAEGASPDEADAPSSEEAQQAADWLETFRRQSDQHTVLTVPYGDLDVASVLRHDFTDLFEEALELSAQTMDQLGVEATPVIAPASGFLPREVLPKLDPGTSVLLSEAAVPSAPQPVVETDRGHRIALRDSSVEAGGPRPSRPFQALALRQRILSQAALHALSADRSEPLIVSTPQLWDPGGQWQLNSFFSGFDAPWLRTVDLPTATAEADPPATASSAVDVRFTYPPSETRAELSIPNLLATQELDDTGKVLANLLSENDTVDEELAKSAMLASTYRARHRPNLSLLVARKTTALVQSLMKRVRVEAPPFVTLSSKEGPFGITIVNDLDQPVTVGVLAETGNSGLVIPSPDPVSLGPGQRASLRLRATSGDIGVHSVNLVPTNGEGQALGGSTGLSVRSSQVGMVIWVIMGVTVALLFLASGVRILRRVRSRRSRHDRLLEDAAG